MPSRIFLVGLAFLGGFALRPEIIYAQTDSPTPAPAAPPLPAPVISRDAAGVVTITSPDPAAVIAYTLDGTAANGSSGRYLAPIDLPAGGTVNAVAVSADRQPASPKVSASFLPLTGRAPLPGSFVPVTQERSFPKYDWAKRHAEVSEEVARKKPEILFIGDSITHRFLQDGTWKERYAPRAVNLGFGWDRIENALWRIQHGELADARPKVVVVLVGTNNLEKNSDVDIAAGIQNLVTEIHARLPASQILLLGIFPRGKVPGPLTARITNINQLLQTLDGKNGVTVLDIGTQLVQSDGSIASEVMGDALHPSPVGYRIWADAMDPTLNKLLGNP